MCKAGRLSIYRVCYISPLLLQLGESSSAFFGEVKDEILKFGELFPFILVLRWGSVNKLRLRQPRELGDRAFLKAASSPLKRALQLQ